MGLLRDCTTGCGTDGALHSTNINICQGVRYWRHLRTVLWAVPGVPAGAALLPGGLPLEGHIQEEGDTRQWFLGKIVDLISDSMSVQLVLIHLIHYLSYMNVLCH